jgi:hypothetical protein
MFTHFLFPKVFQGLVLIVAPAEKLKVLRRIASTKGERFNMIDLKVPS